MSIAAFRSGTHLRARPLESILAAARQLAGAAGVTRLAELTGLDGLGFPVFQAVRPSSRSLTTAMGRGPTRRAAIASALLEAIETDLAERVEAVGAEMPLAALDAAARATWHGTPRDVLGIRLNPDVPRFWMPGLELSTGAPMLVPFDLVSQDLTGAGMADTLTTTIGLATGGDRNEAVASSVAELLEYDFDADWRRGSAGDRRRCELDASSVTDPAVAAAIARVAAAGCTLRLWSTGQDHGIAVFLCAIADGPRSATRLPPVNGGGCHPDRAVAALRAISEAAQGRAAMIAGARDDLEPHFYADPDRKRVELVLAALSFGPGPLAWQEVPTVPGLNPVQALGLLLATARSRSRLPLIVVPLGTPHQHLEVVKVIAPGLRIPARDIIGRSFEPAHRPLRQRARPGRRVLFVGPSLWSDTLPSAIERRPPAVAGDLAMLLDDPPERVALVDGCFETGPAVWHKELLDLIAAGVAVYGAASLGAIRAAELAGDGMIGVGDIFAAYRDGMVKRDDAVMLSHAPAGLGYRPLTIALVDAEAAIAMVPDARERRLLQRIARTEPFRSRSWPRMLERYRERAGHPSSVAQAALAAAPSLKRQDALRLVDLLMQPVASGEPRPRPPLTSYYRRLLTRSLAMPR